MRVTSGTDLGRDDFFRSLDRMQYGRNDMALSRGTFRVRGDIIELQPAYDETGLRIELFGEHVEAIRRIHPLTGKVISSLDEITIFPAKHFTTSRVGIEAAVQQIHRELQDQLAKFRAAGKLLEAQRLEQRTLYDIEMLREVGFVSGIENYSRILDGRAPGSRPYTLIDFFKPPVSHRDRRIACVHPPDPGHVQRRPRAQGNARGTRVPHPLRA